MVKAQGNGHGQSLGRQGQAHIYVVFRAVVAESEKRNIAGVLGEEIQTLHIQNRGLQDEVGM